MLTKQTWGAFFAENGPKSSVLLVVQGGASQLYVAWCLVQLEHVAALAGSSEQHGGLAGAGDQHQAGSLSALLLQRWTEA